MWAGAGEKPGGASRNSAAPERVRKGGALATDGHCAGWEHLQA